MARARQATVPPVLVRQLRGGIQESAHRGDVVEVDSAGRVIRAIGDPNRPVLVGSCANPFSLVALIEAGGIKAFDLDSAELALMAGSHSGEDLHVRTLQGVFRRANISQTLLACGSEGMPLDELTAARLARDGERAGSVRHTCSGQHAVPILLCKLKGWEPFGYWEPEHPAQVAITAVVAQALGATPGRLPSAIDACGLITWSVPLHDLARAYALLAQPDALAPTDPRAALVAGLTIVRDAMVRHPEMVAGSRDRLDTSLMKALPGKVISKSGGEALRAVAILAGRRTGASTTASSGLAVTIEDGGGHKRAPWAAGVEALCQAGVLVGAPLRELGRYHRPVTRDPNGRVVAETVADFALVPFGELTR